MNHQILHTKLRRPRLASDILPRARLFELLQEGIGRPLTLISAPAGYGKSTLASRWAEAFEGPVGWVSLDESDNDLRMFLSYFIASIRLLFPKMELGVEGLLQADPLPSVSIISNRLLNDLFSIKDPFVLVLDDYHNIKETCVHELMTQLLAHPPDTMHLVLATRSDPPLPVATMRGRGLVTEIRAADLRFRSAEVKAFLHRMLNVDIDETTSALLEMKTEGWAAGLRMAGIYLQGRKDLKKRVRQMSGSSRHVAEYLVAEVISRQHPEMVSYMLETSILERFCAPLCRQIHRTGPFGCSGEPEIGEVEFIQRMVTANLFVIALDDEGCWFRYHHLFQLFLKEELRKRRTADRIADLHRTAGKWFAENDLIEEAIGHYLAAGESQVAVRLVIEHRYELLNNAQYHLLNKWLALLPREIVNEEPLLVTARAITAWVNGQREDVEKFTIQAKRLVDKLSAESSEYAILQGEIITLHNLICALNNKPAEAWLDAVEALGLLPKNAFFFRMVAIAEMAFRRQMKGDLDEGVKLLKDELKTFDLPVSIQARGWFYLCVVNYMDCKTSGTLLSGLKSLELAEKYRLAHTRGLAKYFIGVTYYLRNELTKAKHYMKGSIDDCDFTNAIYVIQARSILSFIYLAEGRPDKAESVIEQEVDSPWAMRDNCSPAIRKALRVEIELRKGMVAEASRLSIGVDFDILPLNWYLYMPQLTSIKLLVADGTDQGLEDAQSRLLELDRKMRGINRKCVRIEVLALLALVCHRRNEQDSATEHLRAALDLAEPQGWIRTFVDLGRPMVDLLMFLIQQQAGKTYAQKVLKVCQAEHRKNEPSEPVATTKTRFLKHCPHDILTQREIEILPLLAEGLKNKEIAARLYISPMTVKTHMQNIFKKLNAKNRLEALMKSREFGVIVDK